MGISLRKIFSLSMFYGIAPILDRLLSLLLLPVLTYYLDTEVYGSLMLLYTGGFFVALVVKFELSDTLTKLYWDYEGQKRKELLGTAWVFTEGMVIASALVLLPLSGVIARGFFENPDVSFLIVLQIIVIAVSTQQTVPFVVCRSLEQKYRILASNMLSIGVRVGLTLLLVIVFRLGVVGVFIAEIAGSLAAFTVYAPVLVKSITITFKTAYIRKIFELAPYRVLSGALAWGLNLSDRIVIQYIMKDASAVGVYSVGYTFGSAVLFLIGPVFSAWTPHVFKIHSISRSAYVEQMGWFFEHFSFLCMALFLLIAVLSPDVIRILTPREYHYAGVIVAVVLCGQILAQISNYFLPTFFITIRTGLITWVYAVCMMLNLGMNFYLIPKIGVMGAAWATLASYGLMCLIVVIISQRLIKVKLHLARTGLLWGACFGMYWILRQPFELPALWGLMAKGLLLLFVTAHGAAWLYLRRGGFKPKLETEA